MGNPNLFFGFLNVRPFSPGGFFTFLVALAHEFYESHFWRVLVIWPNCVLVLGSLGLPEKEKDASKLRIAYGPKQH